jgi:hypothetical protein
MRALWTDAERLQTELGGIVASRADACLFIFRALVI